MNKYMQIWPQQKAMSQLSTTAGHAGHTARLSIQTIWAGKSLLRQWTYWSQVISVGHVSPYASTFASVKVPVLFHSVLLFFCIHFWRSRSSWWLNGYTKVTSPLDTETPHPYCLLRIPVTDPWISRRKVQRTRAPHANAEATALALSLVWHLGLSQRANLGKKASLKAGATMQRVWGSSPWLCFCAWKHPLQKRYQVL